MCAGTIVSRRCTRCLAAITGRDASRSPHVMDRPVQPRAALASLRLVTHCARGFHAAIHGFGLRRCRPQEQKNPDVLHSDDRNCRPASLHARAAAYCRPFLPAAVRQCRATNKNRLAAVPGTALLYGVPTGIRTRWLAPPHVPRAWACRPDIAPCRGGNHTAPALRACLLCPCREASWLASHLLRSRPTDSGMV